MAARGAAGYRFGYLMCNALSLRRAGLSLGLAMLVPLAAHAQRACEDAVVAAPAGGWAPPLDTRVTLHARDISLRDALDRLTVASRVSLAYSVDYLPGDHRVCVSAEQQPLGALLGGLLRGAHIQVIVVAGRVVLSPGAVVAPTESSPSPTVSLLDRVVVTGNAVASPRRPLVIGVEVIDGEQLRRQSLGSLAEMLDAAVPGVWSWTLSPSSMVSQYGGIRGASSFGSSAPKIYIDGVEVANPLLVTQLNPDVVDRVEVIRGPQGSALYGSDAISGVINVLTRHDGGAVTGPLVQLRSVAGAASSSYVSGLVPTHEQRLTVRVGSNVKSAGAAVTYGQTGALYPASETRQLAATGDARLVSARETIAMSLQLFDKVAGAGRNPLIPVSATVASGSVDSIRLRNTVASPSTTADQAVRQYTLSTSAAFATEGRWTHTVLAGIDGYHLKNVAENANPISTALDAALRASQGNGDRVTLRASSVARLGGEAGPQGTFTVGVEQSVLRQASSITMQVPGPAGQKYYSAVDGMAETWNHNTGLLSQVSTSWDDAIFLTGGLRVERNDAFSGSNRYPLLPMVGLAVVRDVGGAELKWRAAYGKGIRPPQTPARSASSGYTNNMGYTAIGGGSGLNAVLPALDPEVQSGYEGGVELYFGKTLSLQLTRFDQRVSGLIQNVSVAIDTLVHNGRTERRVRYQLQNVGEITNTGWELQGTATHGPFSLNGAVSSVDSRVRTLARGYLGDLRPGDRMLAVPARTVSATATWFGGAWLASLGATRAMDWVNYDRLSLANWYLTQNPNPGREPTGARLRSYWREYNGETHLRLTGSRDLSRGVSLLMVGENLLGGQLGEPDNVTIRPGRTVTAGLRAAF